MRGRCPPLAVLSLLVAVAASAAVAVTPAPLYASPPGLAPALARALPADDALVPLEPGTGPEDGANTPEYRLCVQSRYEDVCGPDGVDDGVTGRVDPDLQRDPLSLPWSLRMTNWDCLSDARYRCTHTLTNDALQRTQVIRHNALAQVQVAEPHASWSTISSHANVRAKEALDALPPVRKQMIKYHGHWVFVRVGGIEEPLSALGMLLTFVTHLVTLSRLRARGDNPAAPALPDTFPLANLYSLSAFAWAVAALGVALGSVRHMPLLALVSAATTHVALAITLFQGLARMGRWAPAKKDSLPLRHATAVAQGAYRFRAGVWLVCALLFSEALCTVVGVANTSFFASCNAVLVSLAWAVWLLLTLRPHILSGSTPISLSMPAIHSDTDELVGGGASASLGRRTVLKRLRSVLLVILAGVWLERVLDAPPLWRTLDAHAAWALIQPLVAIMWHTALSADAKSVVASGYWADPIRARPVRSISPSGSKLNARMLSQGALWIDRGCARASKSITASVSLLSSRLERFSAQRRAIDPDDKLAALLDPDTAPGAAVALADSIGITKALPELKVLAQPEMQQA